jgi:putative hydrolase of the HAD superfamily
VTGTLVSFCGNLEEHYLGAAHKCGVDMSPDAPIGDAFHQAYKEVSLSHPCFGGNDITAKEWWKMCVLRSFDLAGVEMNEAQQEIVFQKIYSTFGSQLAYKIFGDALPFLRWAHRNNIVCGVLSNADERYGDSILPMLGLTDGLQFQCYSKDFGLEKPDARFYFAAMKQADPWLSSDDPLLSSQVLHVGNDYSKDFEGARRAGMHAVLLDRYHQKELTDEWKRRGALVFEDLIDIVEFLGRCKTQLG